MPWYKCTIEGQSFPGSLISKPGLVGFFATRFVKAPSAEEAESLSLAELRRDDRFKIPSAGLQPPDARVFFAASTGEAGSDLSIRHCSHSERIKRPWPDYCGLK